MFINSIEKYIPAQSVSLTDRLGIQNILRLLKINSMYNNIYLRVGTQFFHKILSESTFVFKIVHFKTTLSQ